MSSTFVYTPRGYINISRIEEIRIADDGRRQLVVDGQIADDNNKEITDLLVSTSPCSGDYECVTACHEDNVNDFSLSVEPVILWGLTATGQTVPVTPGEPSGVEGPYAIRRRGETRLFAMSRPGGFASAEDWLKDAYGADTTLVEPR